MSCSGLGNTSSEIQVGCTDRPDARASDKKIFSWADLSLPFITWGECERTDRLAQCSDRLKVYRRATVGKHVSSLGAGDFADTRSIQRLMPKIAKVSSTAWPQTPNISPNEKSALRHPKQ